MHNYLDYSIITVTRNRKESLFKCLQKTRTVITEDVQIIVYDDASDDQEEIYNAVVNIPNLLFIRGEKQIGPAGGRNRCLEAATTEFCISLDDDCFLNEEPQLRKWINNILKKDNIAVVCFSYLRTYDLCYAPPKGTPEGETHFFHGGASMLHRPSILKAGGFLEWLSFGGEDTELAMRLTKLGYKIWFDPSVVVFHDHWQSGRNLDRESFFYVRNTLIINALKSQTCKGFTTSILKGIKRGYTTKKLIPTIKGIIAGISIFFKKRKEWNNLIKK